MWCQCALHEGTLVPPGKYDWKCVSFSPPESTTQMANRSVQSFLHSSRQKVPILYNGRSFPTELPLPMGISGPPSNTWFPGPIWIVNPNGISIGSAIFAGLTSVTDRPTDHATRSVTIGRIYVCSNAMRCSLIMQPACQSVGVASYIITGMTGVVISDGTTD